MLSTNWFYEAVHYFRMPLFFFLSGLFLIKALNKPLPFFLGYRIADLMYVFILWTVFRSLVDALFAGGGIQQIGHSIAFAFIAPLPGLWFIYTLAVFSLAARALRRLNPTIITAAAAVAAATIAGTSYGVPEHSTSIELLDKWGMYFVYFYLGHTLRELAFTLSIAFRWSHLALAVTLFVVAFGAVESGFAPVNGATIFIIATSGIWLSCLGSFVVSRTAASSALGYIGRRSLPIYLGHIFVISFARQGLKAAGLLDHASVLNVALVIAGVLLPLAGYEIAGRCKLDFLFKLPTPVSAFIAKVVDGRRPGQLVSERS